MDFIFLDTETTGLLLPEATEIMKQPRIIEIYAARFSPKRKLLDEFGTFVNPRVPISDEITRITGITDDDVEGQPEFVQIYNKLCNFFRGSRTLVAHNCAFDSGMIAVELMRIDKHWQFPWPSEHICTVEKSYQIKDRRLKLGELNEMATGQPEIKGAHRAQADTLALADCYWWLEDEDLL